jgi:hypothetical protein
MAPVLVHFLWVPDVRPSGRQKNKDPDIGALLEPIGAFHRGLDLRAQARHPPICLSGIEEADRAFQGAFYRPSGSDQGQEPTMFRPHDQARQVSDSLKRNPYPLGPDPSQLYLISLAIFRFRRLTASSRASRFRSPSRFFVNGHVIISRCRQCIRRLGILQLIANSTILIINCLRSFIKRLYLFDV